MSDPKFRLGEVIVTAGVLALAETINDPDLPSRLVARHAAGDWGDIAPGDKEMNDEAVRLGHDLILSAYLIGDAKVRVKTEWDRSCTVVTLPEED